MQKTAKAFSSIPLDQAHEQNNALIRGEGGAIGIPENPNALLRSIETHTMSNPVQVKSASPAMSSLLFPL